MTSALSRTVSSPSTRRAHYHSQLSNASLSLSQSFSSVESSTLNESSSSPFMYSNPLVTIIYSTTLLSKDNHQILLNSYASCRRLLEHMKPLIGVQQEETIDLMDNEGKLKELNTHGDEYASQYLTARNTYYVFKVEIDSLTGEKRYTPSFNSEQIDQKVLSILTNSLNSLNKAVAKTKRPAGLSKQNTTSQLTSNSSQSKTKRTTSRK